MKHYFCFVFLMLISLSSFAKINFEGKKSLWFGFEKTDFVLEGRNALVVAPEKPRSDNAWVLRPAFFGAFPNADVALLKKGFYVAYFDVTHDYARPQACELMDKFYAFMTSKYGLNKKVSLEGLSRGGAFSLIWANANVSKLACVYVDNPVCDFLQWPVKRQPNLKSDFMKKWNLKTDKEVENFKNNPIDKFENLAKSGVPVLMIVGGKDRTTPYYLHGKIYKERFFDAGGNLSFIYKKDADHHPHGLDNPTPIVEFIEDAYSDISIDRTSSEYTKFNHIKNRNGIQNAFKIFNDTLCGEVAFVGGSITEMNGWRNFVMQILQKRFPKTKFEFYSVGISSLGTTPHAFRLLSDLPNLKNVDLLFIEGAVNDDTNKAFTKAGAFSLEGIVRQCLKANSKMDIVNLHFIYDDFLKLYEAQKEIEIISEHEKIAEHYKIPSINLSDEIWQRMQARQFDWRKFGGTHPAPFGHKYYARAIENLFEQNKVSGKIVDKYFPEKLCKNALDCGKYVDVSKAKIKNGWIIEKSWKAKTKAHVRSRFANLEILETRRAGAELEFDFEGNVVGAYMLAGDEAGTLEFSIDGKPFKKIDTFTVWSKSLYLPMVLIFEDNLTFGKHKLTLRMSSTKNPKSNGTACQIIKFAVNGK